MKFTQIGWATLAILLVLAVFLMTSTLASDSWQPSLAAWVPTIVLGAVGLLFGWLTVEVDAENLRIAFGVGLIRYRWPLASIAGVKPVRNSLWTGFGIRIGPNFTLYNVSGRDAVELKFRSSTWRVRIGTDQPAALAEAIIMSAQGARNADALPLLDKTT